jgi:putative membrane protein
MNCGILFRREITINYARIQDIHLLSNVVACWCGLTIIFVQTASGNASAELTIEGLKEFESVGDVLYSKMRGVKDLLSAPAPPIPTVPTAEACVLTGAGGEIYPPAFY